MRKNKKIDSLVLWVKPIIRSENWPSVLILLAITMFILNVLLIYPGQMTSDTLVQYSQAAGDASYQDWQPPIMALFWSLLLKISGRSSSMMVVQMIALWSSLCIFSIYSYKQTKKRSLSLIFLAVGALPTVLSISGVIWKDVQMALSLLVAIVILKFWPKQRKDVIIASIFVIILTSYATMLRYNAAIAVLPILYLLLSYLQKNKLTRIILSVALTVFMFVLAMALPTMIGAIKTNPNVAVMIDDIVNIKQNDDFRDASPSVREYLTRIQQECSLKRITLNGFWLCTTSSERNVITKDDAGEIKSLWQNRIKSNLFSYAKYRIKTYGRFLIAIERLCLWTCNIQQNIYNFHLKNPALAAKVGQYYINFSYDNFGFLFTAWFWLLASSLLVLIARKMKTGGFLIEIIGISALLYLVAYLPINTGIDYRYFYWTVLATTVGYLLYFTETYNITSRSKSKK